MLFYSKLTPIHTNATFFNKVFVGWRTTHLTANGCILKLNDYTNFIGVLSTPLQSYGKNPIHDQQNKLIWQPTFTPPSHAVPAPS
ncbi:Uncharacterised protein [Moraxella lacunata]|uniref:Uncharacterized protein n=1 Tax=Moraxella lacunata TaxID=477 RepID=A0A378QH55_MORLA|nr:Uncharacterised protein [Moraxella lacunata]